MNELSSWYNVYKRSDIIEVNLVDKLHVSITITMYGFGIQVILFLVEIEKSGSPVA